MSHPRLFFSVILAVASVGRYFCNASSRHEQSQRSSVPSAPCLQRFQRKRCGETCLISTVPRGGSYENSSPKNHDDIAYQHLQSSFNGAQLENQRHNVFAKAAAMGSTIAERPKFDAAIYIASANMLVFSLRPDPHVAWFARIPRLLWEASLLVIAKAASSTISPSLYILLCIMTLSTSLVDVFVWAPMYAFFVSFETCSGGGFFSEGHCVTDRSKGFSRMAVSIVCILGGVIYLMTAVQAWGAFISYRDEQKIHRAHRIQREWQHMNQENAVGSLRRDGYATRGSTN
mmetsp:Transcript_2264/g.4591  ORF Transcript_2264/g.4591 Transcript_2264/m.4591 type:complete len:288 (+) Transcript_2264:161-1024(+)|eukprot:CAMPEP_0168735752 /NCGR_PEP_ID=MMETSP0724-20121128/9502_1 /TAXON_ID=265536 /ORGANISM="Amphiprora sp., Strain CCMP467" /LENGTH=287 /DNA_ID=CAMNT_0008782919 /DNA_START=29 /DNA_END=892 /DNA_ORIENTATION=+